MTKNTKILLGAGILAAGAYFYMQSKKTKSFANVAGKKWSCPAGKQKYQRGPNEFYCIDPRGYSPSSLVKKVND
jgi:hypothetical protein